MYNTLCLCTRDETPMMPGERAAIRSYVKSGCRDPPTYPAPPLRKHQPGQESDGQTGSWCLDKAVLAQGGGGYLYSTALLPLRPPITSIKFPKNAWPLLIPVAQKIVLPS